MEKGTAAMTKFKGDMLMKVEGINSEHQRRTL
jgi:hypothetical protein